MNPHPFTNEEEKIFWIENVISDYQDGTASPNEVKKLRALLLADPEARRIYYESNQLTLLLEEARIPTPQASRKPRVIFRWVTGIAAALAIGLWLSPSHDDAPTAQAKEDPWLATLSSSHEAKWDSPEDILGRFKQGEIELLSGIAELKFKNGAQIIIEGPCALKIVNAKKVELEHGKLWGHCPPSAHGFEVLAPRGNRIVDLGTEFGVGVTPSGEVEVHVFDGEVEVFPNDQKRQALYAGSAIKICPGEKPFPLDANAESFTDTYELQSDLYHQHHFSLLQRDDLLLYYDFSAPLETPSVLRDSGPSQLNGKVIGALPVKGRMADKDALLFEQESDAVAIDLKSLTLGNEFSIAMWIKPTDFARSHMALFNSNGFRPGAIHLQILDDGRLMTAINGFSRFASPKDTVKTNVWQHVAVSWNIEEKNARLFVNGELLETRKSDFRTKIPVKAANFGKCQIGSWSKPTYGHKRSFEGRIDEVILFSGQLSEVEMSLLFETSRP